MIDTTHNTYIEHARQASSLIYNLQTEVSKVIIGQEDVITFIIISLLCNGHFLLEGVPGVAKTTMIKAITHALGLQFKRIQFTPDLLPADLIGTLIYNQKTNEFETKKGPIFANVVLADEINRAPAKVQSALLEAMQERQVTIGSHTYHLESPFLVFATQNPLEQEGTYKLPEAQLDRFLCKILVQYPSRAEEKALLTRKSDVTTIQPILTIADIALLQDLVTQIYVDERILEYIVQIICATRNPKAYTIGQIESYIQCGASPRATLALLHTAKAYAFIRKRHFVTPDDIKMVANAVLRHRIMLSYEAEADGVSVETVIQTIISSIPAP
ncbi:MAG TPA: MoxR family ATPase [Candidatus Babeliales bacterium]|nr:MoxR family ATPase [Candidatus Babeliales bacterium]